METYFPHLENDAVTSSKAKQKHKSLFVAVSLITLCILAWLSLS